MKILQVHNRYRTQGGEDTVVANEAGLLQAAGHDVQLYEAFNMAPKNTPTKLIAAAKLFVNKRERGRLASTIRKFQPDIVHFHNTFQAMGSSVLTVPRDLGVPSCLTNHNYRLFCIAGNAFRDGHICTDCCGRSALPGAWHACYKGSRSQSFALASATTYHNLRRSAHAMDAIACLNRMQLDLLRLHGFDKRKLVIKPNFTQAEPRSSLDRRSHFLFVGLLSQEKGLAELANQYEPGKHLPLDIVGQGPLKPKLEEWAKAEPSIKVHGYLERTELDRLWSRARFLVFPSLWFEGMPMVVLEALSRGIPVVANTTSAGGWIASTSGGICYGAQNTLHQALSVASQIDVKYAGMCEQAKATHTAHFSMEEALPQLMNLYETAIQNHRQAQA